MRYENLGGFARLPRLHIVRSLRDLAKPYLQVVYSDVLASPDSPVTPSPFRVASLEPSSSAMFCAKAGSSRLPRLRIARSCRDLPILPLEMFRLRVFATSCCHAKYHRRVPHIPGGTSSAFPGAPVRARNDRHVNLLEQARPLTINTVRSLRDLAKAYLQVVYIPRLPFSIPRLSCYLLASPDSPVTPCPDECHTFA